MFEPESQVKFNDVVFDEDAINELKTLSVRDIMGTPCIFFKFKCYKDMGTFGTESPIKLVDFMAKKMKSRDGYLDAIIMNGDFVKHGVSQDTDDNSTKVANW